MIVSLFITHLKFNRMQNAPQHRIRENKKLDKCSHMMCAVQKAWSNLLPQTVFLIIKVKCLLLARLDLCNNLAFFF